MDKEQFNKFSKAIAQAIQKGLPIAEENTKISRLAKKIKQNGQRIEYLKIEIIEYRRTDLNKELLLLRQLRFYQKKELANLIEKERACQRCGAEGNSDKDECPYSMDIDGEDPDGCNCCAVCREDCAQEV